MLLLANARNGGAPSPLMLATMLLAYASVAAARLQAPSAASRKARAARRRPVERAVRSGAVSMGVEHPRDGPGEASAGR